MECAGRAQPRRRFRTVCEPERPRAELSGTAFVRLLDNGAGCVRFFGSACPQFDHLKFANRWFSIDSSVPGACAAGLEALAYV
jgi:hypothetical protein